MGDGVAHRGAVDLLDPGDQEADLAGPEDLAFRLLGREYPDAVRLMGAPGGQDEQLVAAFDRAIDDPHQGDDSHIGVEPGVDDEGLQRAVGIAHGRRDSGDQAFE